MNQEQANKFLDDYRNQVPETVHACTLVFNQAGITDLNQIYFQLQTAYTQMLTQLSNENIDAKGILVYDTPKGDPSPYGEIDINKFWYLGFPRMIPEMHKVRALFLFLEMRQGVLCTNLRFVYESGSFIIYSSTSSK